MLREIRSTVVQVIVLLVVAALVYLKVKKDATAGLAALPSTDEVAASVTAIVKGAPSAIASVIKGEGEQGYITDAQQRALAAARLAEKRQRAAILGVS